MKVRKDPWPQYVCVLGHLSHVWLFVALLTLAHQASLLMGFSRQEHWSGCHALLQEIFQTQDQTWVSCVSCIAGRFFTMGHRRSPTGPGQCLNPLRQTLLSFKVWEWSLAPVPASGPVDLPPYFPFLFVDGGPCLKMSTFTSLFPASGFWDSKAYVGHMYICKRCVFFVDWFLDYWVLPWLL